MPAMPTRDMTTLRNNVRALGSTCRRSCRSTASRSRGATSRSCSRRSRGRRQAQTRSRTTEARRTQRKQVSVPSCLRGAISQEIAMIRTTLRMTALGAGTLLALATLASPPSQAQTPATGAAVAFTNARIIDGTGRRRLSAARSSSAAAASSPSGRPHRRRSPPARSASTRAARRSFPASSTPTRISTWTATSRCRCATI